MNREPEPSFQKKPSFDRTVGYDSLSEPHATRYRTRRVPRVFLISTIKPNLPNRGTKEGFFIRAKLH